MGDTSSQRHGGVRRSYIIITIAVNFQSLHVPPGPSKLSNGTKTLNLSPVCPGHPRVNALILDVRGSGPHPDGYGHQETTKINLFYHTKQLLFPQHYHKVIPWGTLGSMPYSWVSKALDLAQMVMDIWKQCITTILIITNNLCFNSNSKK